MPKSGLLHFACALLANPRAVGAACPSSKKLARSMARAVPLSDTGVVIELGAGTGVVTQALLDHGVSPKQLIVIERSEALVKHLRKRFPQLTIIHGDARELVSLVALGDQAVIAVVSSLPLRSLSKSAVQHIMLQLDKLLSQGSYFIQYTYAIHRGMTQLPEGLVKAYSRYVIGNIPPARVDVFRYKG